MAPRLQFETNKTPNAINRSHFALDLHTWTFLNHGAFGASTHEAIKAVEYWHSQANKQPLKFHDRDLFPLLMQSIEALATFLEVSNPKELVLLPNATSGLHAVLASILQSRLAKAKTVVLFSTRYDAVRAILQSLQDTHEPHVHVHEEELSLSDSYDDNKVLDKLEKAFKAVEASGRSVTLVVVDHITSTTAVLMPLRAIIERCHSRGQGVPVLVDGAHGPLNIPLDLDALNADYYVGNCHKWLCAPRGAAFLHVKRVDGPRILPRVVSYGYKDGMQRAFLCTGMQDYSAWLTLPHCLAYWRRQGVDATRAYMHTLAHEGARVLSCRWHLSTHVQALKVPRVKRHAMRLVQLPTMQTLCGGVVVDEKAPNATLSDAQRVQDALYSRHRIEVPIKCVERRLYVRISAHVYNNLEDFERLAVAMIESD